MRLAFACELFVFRSFPSELPCCNILLSHMFSLARQTFILHTDVEPLVFAELCLHFSGLTAADQGPSQQNKGSSGMGA